MATPGGGVPAGADLDVQSVAAVRVVTPVGIWLLVRQWTTWSQWLAAAIPLADNAARAVARTKAAAEHRREAPPCFGVRPEGVCGRPTVPVKDPARPCP
ncbi:hypothetical protein ACWD0G_00060 [Streptomyces goshikiensis]